MILRVRLARWSDAGTMTIAAPSTIRKSPDHLGRALGLPKHWQTALKSALLLTSR